MMTEWRAVCWKNKMSKWIGLRGGGLKGTWWHESAEFEASVISNPMFREWDRSITGWAWVGHWGCFMTRKKGKEAGSQRTTPVGGGRGNDKELKEGCKRKLQKWNKNQTFHRNEPWVWNGTPSATGFNVPMCVCGSKEGGAQMKQDRLCDDWWHEWWVPRGSPRYFIHFQFLRFFFFFKILKVSHWTQIFKKIFIMASTISPSPLLLLL